MDAAEAQFGGGGMGMGMSGNGASALGQSNLMLGDMLEDDDGRPENNVVRRDVEPPLYQAPTFSHLVRSQENLQLLHRPVGSGSVLQGAGSKLQFSSSRVHAPAPSAEPLGFGAAGSRFVKPRLQDAASVETLRVVQPPPRMTRAGGSLADTTAVVGTAPDGTQVIVDEGDTRPDWLVPALVVGGIAVAGSVGIVMWGRSRSAPAAVRRASGAVMANIGGKRARRRARRARGRRP